MASAHGRPRDPPVGETRGAALTIFKHRYVWVFNSARCVSLGLNEMSDRFDFLASKAV